MIDKAYFILSKKETLQKYEEIKSLSDIVSYSLKTNFEIGKVLQSNTNCMFSVHSVESANYIEDGRRVLFFVQTLSEKTFNKLTEKNIKKFVIDNVNDLNDILRYSEKQNVKIWILLRMRLKEHTIHTGKHFVFGFYSKYINKIVPILRRKKYIEKLGLHFHRKTQNLSEWSLKEEINETIKPKIWKHIDLVNIGGGIPSNYKNFNENVMKSIFKKIESFKTWINEKNIIMISEPGRYIASYPITLHSKIINVYENNIIINCSVFNGAMDTFVSNIKLLVQGEKSTLRN